jgi:hypothetical protein
MTHGAPLRGVKPLPDRSGHAFTGRCRRLPLDDLSHLAEMIGDAHVVAIGENNHHIGEL